MPRRPAPPTTRWALVLAAAAVGLATVAAGCGNRLSGRYEEVGGTGRMEFKGSKVYVTTVLGMTYAAEYEVDGPHIVIKGAGGSQVFTRDGDTLEGGLGTRFVRVPEAQ